MQPAAPSDVTDIDAGPPDVSIIVIAFDVRSEVMACLASIHAHGRPLAVETILVDNGSTDGTVEAVSRRYPDVRIVRRPKNEGVRARNHGLRLASGRYRMFLDSDAELTEGALQRLVDVLRRHPGVGLVGPRLAYPDGTLQLSARRFPPLLLPLLRRPPLDQLFERRAVVRRHLMADEPHDRLRAVPYVIGACQLFSASAQAAAGEIDPRIRFGPDDVDWCLKIRAAGLKVAYEPAATVIHDYRRGTAGRPLSRLALEHLMSYYRFQLGWRLGRRQLYRRLRASEEDRDLGPPR